MPSKQPKSPLLQREWFFAGGNSPAQRLEKFLQQEISNLSRQNIRALIADGSVLVNQRTSTKGYRLQPGDRLQLKLPGPADAGPVPEENGDLKLIYQDHDLIVADKPAPVPSHPLSPFESGTMANLLIARFPELSGVGPKPLEAGLIHRLDTGTSGILVAGRNPAAWSHLKHDLTRRLWKKKYLALVSGITESEGVIRQPLAHHPTDRKRMLALGDPNRPHRGRVFPAETRFRLLKAFQNLSLLEMDLITGVTHQIRVHLAERGHPVVGDTLYGGELTPGFDLAPGRLFLHAAAVELLHPITREKLHFQSGLPEDLSAFLNSIV